MTPPKSTCECYLIWEKALADEIENLEMKRLSWSIHVHSKCHHRVGKKVKGRRPCDDGRGERDVMQS